MPFRILPLTIAVALMVFGLKLAAIVQESNAFISESVAQEPEKAKETPAEAPKEAAKEEPAAEGEAKEGEAKDAAAKDAAAKEGAAEGDAAGAAGVTLPQLGCDGKTFSQTEIDVLQSLSKRREELDNRGKELQMREDLLKAAEMKVDGKIGELKGLKDELEKLLAEYKKMEDAEIRSLVKIYENMKPKDAAAIFQELDMTTLLKVVERMKEAKAAPVIAAMSPEKAKELTVRLAQNRTLPDQINAASGTAAPEGGKDPVNLKPLPGGATPPASLPPAKQ